MLRSLYSGVLLLAVLPGVICTFGVFDMGRGEFFLDGVKLLTLLKPNEALEMWSPRFSLLQLGYSGHGSSSSEHLKLFSESDRWIVDG